MGTFDPLVLFSWEELDLKFKMLKLEWGVGRLWNPKQTLSLPALPGARGKGPSEPSASDL